MQEIEINLEKIAKVGSIVSGITLLLMGIIVLVNSFFNRYYFEYQFPIIIKSPILLKNRANQKQGQEAPQDTPKQVEEPKEEVLQEKQDNKEITDLEDKIKGATVELAKVTAYTCDSTMTPEQKAMNCPNGITATGTKPRHKITVACPKKNLGKKYEIDGIGEVFCEDVGGAIQGDVRFDLFLNTYQEAIEFGTKYLEYKEI